MQTVCVGGMASGTRRGRWRPAGAGELASELAGGRLGRTGTTTTTTTTTTATAAASGRRHDEVNVDEASERVEVGGGRGEEEEAEEEARAIRAGGGGGANKLAHLLADWRQSLAAICFYLLALMYHLLGGAWLFGGSSSDKCNRMDKMGPTGGRRPEEQQGRQAMAAGDRRPSPAKEGPAPTATQQEEEDRATRAEEVEAVGEWAELLGGEEEWPLRLGVCAGGAKTGEQLRRRLELGDHLSELLIQQALLEMSARMGLQANGMEEMEVAASEQQQQQQQQLQQKQQQQQQHEMANKFDVDDEDDNEQHEPTTTKVGEEAIMEESMERAELEKEQQQEVAQEAPLEVGGDESDGAQWAEKDEASSGWTGAPIAAAAGEQQEQEQEQEQEQKEQQQQQQQMDVLRRGSGLDAELVANQIDAMFEEALQAAEADRCAASQSSGCSELAGAPSSIGLSATNSTATTEEGEAEEEDEHERLSSHSDDFCGEQASESTLRKLKMDAYEDTLVCNQNRQALLMARRLFSGLKATEEVDRWGGSNKQQSSGANSDEGHESPPADAEEQEQQQQQQQQQQRQQQAYDIKLPSRSCSSASSLHKLRRTLVCSVSPTGDELGSELGGGGGGGTNGVGVADYPMEDGEIQQCRAAFRANRRLIEEQVGSAGEPQAEELRPPSQCQAQWAERLRRRTDEGQSVCSRCKQRLYPVDRMELDFTRQTLEIHRNCFKCQVCSTLLRLETYAAMDAKLYCPAHVKEHAINILKPAGATC